MRSGGGELIHEREGRDVSTGNKQVHIGGYFEIVRKATSSVSYNGLRR